FSNTSLKSGRERFSRQFLSLVQTCGRTINSSGERKVGDMRMITSATRNSINHAPYQLALLFIPLALAWLALSPQAQATCQQGCLTNENTVLGDDALSSNTTGFQNTATGFQALFSNTTGHQNTATGYAVLTNK